MKNSSAAIFVLMSIQINFISHIISMDTWFGKLWKMRRKLWETSGKAPEEGSLFHYINTTWSQQLYKHVDVWCEPWYGQFNCLVVGWRVWVEGGYLAEEFHWAPHGSDDSKSLDSRTWQRDYKIATSNKSLLVIIVGPDIPYWCTLLQLGFIFIALTINSIW